MRIWTSVFLGLVLASIIAPTCADAQGPPSRLALKNGETIEIGVVYFVSNCRSTMIGLPEIEILEGPRGATLRIKEEPVLPLRAQCPAKIPGGKLMLTVNGVTGPAEAKLTYRVKYKTFDGDRQRAGTYIL